MLYYLLLPRDDGIRPDHRAIIAQQSAIDFDQFVQDYLRAGEVQIEEAEQRAKRAKEEAEQQARKAKEVAPHQAKKAKEEEEERTRRAREYTVRVLRDIHDELRRFRRQSSLFPDNIKEAANFDEKFKTFTRDFNKHLYLSNRLLSPYELEPVVENYRYVLRVYFAGIGLVILSMLHYLLLPRDDGIRPDHRAIIAQQSAIDFDQFVQDYLRAGEVQIVYFYPGKSIAIAVLQPGALIKGQPFNDSESNWH
uniref:FtsH_ext domain-containing protein n=1 Tax=Globodera pallida TaxID=36090 RepID=A0A183BPB7_GLOPA